MSFQLVHIDSFILLFIYLFIYSSGFYWPINCFALALVPTYLFMLKYYLVLLSSISFLVILSKCYLSCIISLCCELSLTFIFGNKAGVVVVVVFVVFTRSLL